MTSTDPQDGHMVADPSGVIAADQASIPSSEQNDGQLVDDKSQQAFIDPNLEIVTVYDMYDLTIIVGRSYSHRYGQKAFRVSKASLRNASTVWKAMIDSNESLHKTPIIEFPDDTPRGFSLILQIAHLQLSDLPSELTVARLLELASLTDKYKLHDIIGMVLDSKKWIYEHKNWYGSRRPPWRHQCQILPPFAYITKVFGLENDYEYIVSKLMLGAFADSDGSICFDFRGHDLSTSFELSEHIINQIRATRSKIFREWTECYKADVKEALDEDMVPCGDKSCPVTQLGLLMTAFETALFPPSGEKQRTIPLYVHYYWKCIKRLGRTYHGDAPHSTTDWEIRNESSDSEHKCFGEFKVIDKLREIVESHLFEDLRKSDWDRDEEPILSSD